MDNSKTSEWKVVPGRQKGKHGHRRPRKEEPERAPTLSPIFHGSQGPSTSLAAAIACASASSGPAPMPPPVPSSWLEPPPWPCASASEASPLPAVLPQPSLSALAAWPPLDGHSVHCRPVRPQSRGERSVPAGREAHPRTMSSMSTCASDGGSRVGTSPGIVGANDTCLGLGNIWSRAQSPTQLTSPVSGASDPLLAFSLDAFPELPSGTCKDQENTTTQHKAICQRELSPDKDMDHKTCGEHSSSPPPECNLSPRALQERQRDEITALARIFKGDVHELNDSVGRSFMDIDINGKQQPQAYKYLNSGLAMGPVAELQKVLNGMRRVSSFSEDGRTCVPLRYMVRVRPCFVMEHEERFAQGTNSTNECWAELDVVYGPWYPFRRPTVTLGMVSGVRQACQETITKEVATLIKGLLDARYMECSGERVAQECIQPICMEVAAVLRKHHVQQPHCCLSLWEEYQQREQAAEVDREKAEIRRKDVEDEQWEAERQRAADELRNLGESRHQELQLGISEVRAYQAQVKRLLPHAGTLDFIGADSDDDDDNVATENENDDDGSGGASTRHTPQSGVGTAEAQAVLQLQSDSEIVVAPPLVPTQEEDKISRQAVCQALAHIDLHPAEMELSARFGVAECSLSRFMSSPKIVTKNSREVCSSESGASSCSGIVFERQPPQGLQVECEMPDSPGANNISSPSGGWVLPPAAEDLDAPQICRSYQQSPRSPEVCVPLSTPVSLSPPIKSPSSKEAFSLSRYSADFEEIKVLGIGGFGRVTKNRHRVDRQLYAVKRIELSSDPVLTAKLQLECAMLPRLTHTHIVRYYQAWVETESIFIGAMLDAGLDSFQFDAGVGRKVDFLYIQMEFCDGTTLREAIDSGKLQEDQLLIWKLFRQILDALNYIHGKKLIHRDIKPANIFLDKKNVHAKLGDFGLSTYARIPAGGIASSGTSFENSPPRPTRSQRNSPSRQGSCSHSPARRHSSLCVTETEFNQELSTGIGTALYVAPEVRWGSHGQAIPYDHRADLFSLGVVFFEIWHGRCGTHMERAKILMDLQEEGDVEAGGGAHRLRHLNFEVEGADDAPQHASSSCQSLKHRAPARRFPTGFVDRVPKEAITIINSLLSSNPSLRFETADLLHNNLLPASSLDHQMERLLSSLEHNPCGAESSSVIRSLFSRREAPAKDVTFFDQYLQDIPSMTEALAKDTATQHFQLCFRRHGCISVEVPLMHPAVKQAAERSEEHLLVDSANTLLALRTGLTSPFARTASSHISLLHALQSGGSSQRPERGGGGTGFQSACAAALGVAAELKVLRRCHVGPIYREPDPSHMSVASAALHLDYGHPQEVSSAIFDFLWLPSSNEDSEQPSGGRRAARASKRVAVEVLGQDMSHDLWALALESEMVLTCAELFSTVACPNSLRPVLRLTDTRLLSALLRALGLPPASVCELGAHARAFAEEMSQGQGHRGKTAQCVTVLRISVAATLERCRSQPSPLGPSPVPSSFAQRRPSPKSSPTGATHLLSNTDRSLSPLSIGIARQVSSPGASPLAAPNGAPGPALSPAATEVALEACQRLSEACLAPSASASLLILEALLAGVPESEDLVVASSILRGLQKLVDLVEGAQHSYVGVEGTSCDCSSPLVPILVDPLLDVDRSIYSGLAFAVALRGGTASSPGSGSAAGNAPEAVRDGARSLNGSVLCTGGRYDSLIERFAQLHAHGLGLSLGRRSPSSAPNATGATGVARICGISAELAVGKVAHCMLLAEEAANDRRGNRDPCATPRSPQKTRKSAARFSSGSGVPVPGVSGKSTGGDMLGTTALAAAPTGPQVVICHLPSDRYCSDYDEPNGRSLALEVIGLAGGLRRLGVRCETRLVQEPSPDRLLRHCKGLPGCQFLVVLKRLPDDAVKYKVQQLGQILCEKAWDAKEFTEKTTVCEFFAHLKAKNRLLVSASVPSPLMQPKREDHFAS